EGINQGFVGLGGPAFDVDEEDDLGSVRVDAAAVGVDAFEEGVEVERLERAFGGEVLLMVSDQEAAVLEPYVRLDGAEPMVERVEQGPWMLVIVVGVGVGEGLLGGGG